MKRLNLVLTIALFFALFISYAQSGIIRGVILDENNVPLENVNISGDDGSGSVTNPNGFYEIKIASGREVTLVFTHLGHKRVEVKFNLKNGQELEFNPVMKTDVEQIATVVLNSSTRQKVDGVTSISPAIIRTIKGAQPGVEKYFKNASWRKYFQRIEHSVFRSRWKF